MLIITLELLSEKLPFGEKCTVRTEIFGNEIIKHLDVLAYL